MMHRRKWLRRIEIVLVVAGISLLTLASIRTISAWNYQSQQERALFERGPAVAQRTTSAIELAAPQGETVFPVALEPKRATAIEITSKPAVIEPKRGASRKAASDAFARLEIPRLGFKAMVKDGDDEKTLQRAVGRVRGSAAPGETGNMVLAGHRDTFFRSLEDIQTADRIRLVVPPNTYEYRVESVRIVEPSQTEVLQSRGVEELTLVTCYPFRVIGPAPQRFIVSASRVN